MHRSYPKPTLQINGGVHLSTVLAVEGTIYRCLLPGMHHTLVRNLFLPTKVKKSLALCLMVSIYMPVSAGLKITLHSPPLNCSTTDSQIMHSSRVLQLEVAGGRWPRSVGLV